MNKMDKINYRNSNKNTTRNRLRHQHMKNYFDERLNNVHQVTHRIDKRRK